MTVTHAFGYPVVADIDGALVLEVPGMLSRQQADMIKDHIRRAIGRETVILTGGIHLAAVVTSSDIGTPIYDQLVAERSA